MAMANSESKSPLPPDGPQEATSESTAGEKRPRKLAKLAPIDRDSLNLPNLITGSRLLLAGVLFALIDQTQAWIPAAVLFVFAASTDALDGYLARRYGQVTTLGRILDPFVDKVIVCGTFVFLLGVPGSGVNPWMVIIVIGREMFVSSLRGLLEQQGLDFSADWAGKTKMALQCVAVTGSLLSLSPSLTSPTFNSLRDVLLWTAVVVTAYSGVSYIIRAAKLLRQTPTDA